MPFGAANIDEERMDALLEERVREGAWSDRNVRRDAVAGQKARERRLAGNRAVSCHPCAPPPAEPTAAANPR
jgi:hypothetical protein